MLLCYVSPGFNILFIYNLDYSFPNYYITPLNLLLFDNFIRHSRTIFLHVNIQFINLC